jgi:hypothetical protein
MTEPAHAGLLTKGTPIPLEGVAIDAEIRDFCSRVTVTQRYRNREENPIEAMYVFPLDERAAVSGFAAVLGVRLRKLRKKLAGATGDPEEAARAWATALALAWLESNTSESRDEWELLADKAKAWLSRCGAKLAGGEDWLAAAAPALTKRRFWP